MWLRRSLSARLTGIAVLGLAVTTTATTFAQTNIQGKAAQKFVDSLGVNTPLELHNHALRELFNGQARRISPGVLGSWAGSSSPKFTRTLWLSLIHI